MTVFKTGVNLDAAFTQLLGNGKLLIGNFVWEPDEYGRHEYGTKRAVAEMPYTSLYGQCAVRNDGTVLVQTGEYGTTNSADTSVVFDPVTETWAVEGRFGFHSSRPISDVGVQTGFDLPVATEAPIMQLPDGRMYGALGNQVGAPAYAAGVVAAGSFDGDNGVIDHPNVYSGDAARAGTTGSPPIGYERGPAGWMAKIGKAASVLGYAQIEAFDPATNIIHRNGQAWISPKWDPKRCPIVKLGTLAVESTGLTYTQILAAGQVVVDFSSVSLGKQSGNWGESSISGTPPSTQQMTFAQYSFLRPTLSGYISILMTNGNELVLNTSNLTMNGTKGTFVVSGLVSPNEALNTDTVTTGDPVIMGSWRPTAMDSNGGLLPNGDFVYFAGGSERGEIASFNSIEGAFKWDGVNTPVFMGWETVGFMQFTRPVFMLPSGVMSLGRGRFYKPTAAESTPLAAAIPAITSMPSNVTRNEVVTLAGTQLNGCSEGHVMGDDCAFRTNFPLARFRDSATGLVWFGRTFNYSYRGIQPGRASTCSVQIPADIPNGTYQFQVVTSGVPSAVRTITVGS